MVILCLGTICSIVLRAPAEDVGWFLAGQWIALILLLGSSGAACRVSRWNPTHRAELALILGVVVVITGVSGAAELRLDSDFADGRQLESLLGGSNYIAALAVLAALAMLCIVQSLGSIAKVAAWGAVLSAGLLSVTLASRGATTGLALGILAFMFTTDHAGTSRRRTAAVLATIALASILASSAGALLRERLVDGADGNGRTELWRSAASAFMESPVIGIGPGGMPGFFADDGYPVALYAHNIVLSALAQFGMPLGILVLFALAPRSNALRKNLMTPALLAALLAAMVEPSIEGLGYGALYLSVLAVASSYPGSGGKAPHVQRKTPVTSQAPAGRG